MYPSMHWAGSVYPSMHWAGDVSQHALGRGVCKGGDQRQTPPGPEADTLPPADTTEYGQQAGGTHPTGMHSCLNE